MQKCLNKGNESQRLQVVKQIVQHLPELVNDAFGNYVVQQVIKFENEEQTIRIVDYIC